MASPISTPGFPSVRARQSAATCDSAMETRVASLEAIIASLPSLIATAIDNALEKAFEKAFDASLEKFRREMLSRGAGEGISAPLAGDHHASPAIDPIQLPRSPICAEGARSHLSDDQLPRIDLDEEDNFDCVSELLESVDKVTDDDDSDDIVVISEVNSKPSQKSSKRTVADDDDDCVVLDGDPDKPVSVVEDSGSGSDELLVVGETGQVACRDYPHPRHLCAKFPFKTTQPQNHCNLCHCYVCDSLAPCVHWTFNHCYATDEEEIYRTWRKIFKTRKVG
ncbi:RPM1 interacting protein 13-like [Pyrus communis]|uniref:RPM1 interacting protein 13-like n=1 Tax=Pyrus communis TaxID=23211 RepID=UPI0035BFAAAE